jgi:glycosyltransferase involved in cell wall biosynthesis
MKNKSIHITTISYFQTSKRDCISIIYNNIIKTYVALRATALLVRDNPIVYFEYPDSFTIIQNKYLFKLSKVLRLKIVLDVHDTREQVDALGAKRTAINKSFEEFCLKNADLILALNKPMWDHLAETYQIPSGKKVELIPNAYEDEIRQLYPHVYKGVEGRFNVCYMGGITLNSGIYLLFKACENVHMIYPQIMLYLFGPYGDSFPEDLKKEIEGSRFVVRKVISRREIPKAVMNMDLMVMPYNPGDPYMNLSSPTKLFEYIGIAKPILCTKCESLLSLGEGGSIIYADYIEGDFEAKVKMLLERPELREELSRKLMEIRSKHTWSERARVLGNALASLS